VIAYYFPPMGTVSILRNYHISKYLSKLFDSSFLITIKNITIPLKSELSNDFIEEYRVFNFDYRNLGNLLSGEKENLREKANAGSSSRKVKIIRKFLDSFPTNTLFGEGGLFYIISGTFKGIQLVRKNKITHIYSSFRPIADHVIAYNLKRIFPRLKWIADFRDLPIDENRNNVFLKNLQWWFIKTLLKKTYKVITVSDGLNERLKKISEDSITIRNGIYNLYNIDKTNKYSKFTISYTGSIYPEWQKPNILFKIINELLTEKIISKDNFQLLYVGKDSLIWEKWISEYKLESINSNLGEVPMFESIQIQNKSHINLLLSWAGENLKGILTGKLYEYLATDNPIIAFVNGSKDLELEAIFKELNAGFIFYNNDMIKSSTVLKKLINDWKNHNKLNFSKNENAIKNYTWEAKTKELLTLL